jgi:hypothetical protein
MEHNTRPVPDSDLEAYGDWVTIDTAAPTAPVSRHPIAASPDVEIAGELTDAEEEYLGAVSETDLAAASVPEIVPPVHDGNGHANGNGHGGAGNGHPESPAGSPQTAAPATIGDRPTDTSVGAPVHPAAPTPPVVVVPEPLTAVPVPQSRPVETAASAPQAPANLPATPMAPVPAAAASTPHAAPEAAAPAPVDAQPATDQVDREALASLEQRVTALAADVTEVAGEVARLQAARTPAAAAAPEAPKAPAEAASSGPDQVQVSIEEIAHEAAAAEAVPDATDPGSHPAPVIRLVPIADEEGAQPAETTTAAEPDALDAGAPAPDPSAPDPFRNDVRDVLGYLDQLLDELPPKRVREFAQSPQFATYKSLFKELGLDD